MLVCSMMFPTAKFSRRRSNAGSGGQREQPRRRITIARVALLLCLWTLWTWDAPHAVRAEGNLLFNGDLTDGVVNKPDHWRMEGWLTGPEVTTYSWHHDANGAELGISNLKPNDARWVQSVHLGLGWYHFTGLIRTQNVGQSNTGAALSVMEDGIISQQLHGTTNWHKVGFFLKIGHSGANVDVACRLGGYGSLNTGAAFCREVRAEAEAPASSEDPRYDLDIIRGSSMPPQNPDNSALVITILVLSALLLIGLVGWRRFTRDGTERKRIAQSTVSVKPAPRNHVRRRIEITLFLLAALTFAYFYQASDHSTASRIDLIRALLERHTLWIENPYAGYNTADIVELNSHIYSNKAPGGAFAGIIPWAIAATVLKIVVTPDGGLYWALTTYLTTVLTVSLLVALLIVLVYRSALLLGASNGRAVAVALTLGFGTIMLPYATEFTAEPIAAFCIFSAFYLLMVSDREAPLVGRHFCAGFLTGWSVLCDYPTFLLSAGVGAYALWKLRKRRLILAFAAGSSIPAVLLALYNEAAFGNPLFLSYQAYMLPGSDRFPEQAAGFAGVTYPRVAVLWDVLFGAQRGLFFCNPVLLLLIPGLFFFWRQGRHRAEWLVVTYSVLSFVLFNGSYGESIIYWGGGTATGPRHIVSALPFMVLTLAFLPEALNYVFGPLALVSAFLMVMVTAVEPHLPYEYANPFRDFIWPAYMRADLAYNKSTYFGGPPIVGDSVAFNLGKLAGLPGPLQLLPLAAIWLIGARELLNWLELWRDVASRRRAIIAAGLAVGAVFALPTVGSILATPNLNKPHGLLGRYYEGLRPNGFPPHIIRVDREINFDNVAQLGALPPPSSVIWSGKLLISVRGLYRFAITADDNGWLKIDGHWVIDDAAEVTKTRDVGSIQLASGVHSIEVGEHNVWDGALMKLLWQPPGSAEEVVPSRVLIPDRTGHLPS
jgi:hypothetical protein